MRLLVVEDEPDLLRSLKNILEREKYHVDTAMDGEEASDKIFLHQYDLVVLDLMLPKRNGLSVLQEMRKEGGKTPVLILSAKVEIEDRCKGLDLGADDYLPKPFSLAEFLARVRAVLRRGSGCSTTILNIQNISLDPVAHEVKKAGELLHLTSREFSMLEFLLYNKNRVVSRFNLAEHVWGDNFDPFSMSNFIDVHMKNLRKKLGDSSCEIISTVRGIGYIIKENK